MSDIPKKRLPTVSVVIQAYNVAPYIKKAIDSVLAQTCPAAEIIVVNDGSTDDTAQIIQTYGSKVRYIHQENAGVGAACNTGINAAQSEWIAFLDSDDLWMPQKLQRQLELLTRANDLVWATCNFIYRCDQDDSPNPFLEFTKVELELDRGDRFDNFIRAAAWGLGTPRSTMIIKRDVFDQIDPFPVGLTAAEDLDLWLRIAYRWPQIGYVNHPLADYTWKRPDSLAACPIQDQLTILCGVLERQVKLASQYGKLHDLKPLIKKLLTHHVYQVYRNNGVRDLRKLLSRYNILFSPRLKTALRIMTTILPPGAPYAGEISRKLLGYKLPKRTG